MNLLPALLRPYVQAEGLLPHSGADTPGFVLPLAAETVIVFLMPNTVELFRLWDHPGAPAEPTMTSSGLRRLLWAPSARWAISIALILVAALSVIADGGVRASVYGRY